jgi:hypothetical protein
MIISVLESKDAGYFYAPARENCDVIDMHWNWGISKENKSYLLVRERLVLCV